MTAWGRPLWMGAAVSGLIFGTLMAAWRLVDGRGTEDAVMAFLIQAPIFGLVMLLIPRPDVGLNPPEGAPLTRQEQAAAFRAVASGDQPEDDRVREAALRLARRRVGARHAVLVVAVLCAVMALVGVALALFRSAFGWWLAGLWVLAGAYLIFSTRMMTRQARRFLAAR
jgi:hypothetical protein